MKTVSYGSSMTKLTILFFLGYSTLVAQQIMGISYNIGIPHGEMKDFINQTSYTGFGIEGRQFINEHAALGLTFNWSKFNQTFKDYSATNVHAEEHLVDTFPLLFNASYYFLNEPDAFRPFAGMNAGVYFINSRRLGMETGVKDKSLYFGLAPETGFLLEMFYDLNLMVIARYNYAVKSAAARKYAYWTIHLTFVSIKIF
jgi:hypothetical protein